MEIGRWLNFFSNLIKFKNPTTEYNDKEEEEEEKEKKGPFKKQ